VKRIGITQRVDIAAKTGERRDALDQRWHLFAKELGCLLFPLPNVDASDAEARLTALDLDGLILSGGNSLSYLDPAAPDAAAERDRFEAAAIRFAIDRGIPVLGVCRGMQMLNHYFGGRLHPVRGHVACTHSLDVGEDFAQMIAVPVNSYHDWGIAADGLAEALVPIAQDADKNVEAFIHADLKVAGIMWHPEREAPFRMTDITLVERFLG